MKTAWVSFEAIDDDASKALENLLKDLAELSKAEKRCVRYEVFQSEEKPLVYYVRESWQDEAALQNHLEQPHLGVFAEKVVPLLVSPFTFEKINTLVSY